MGLKGLQGIWLRALAHAATGCVRSPIRPQAVCACSCCLLRALAHVATDCVRPLMLALAARAGSCGYWLRALAHVALGRVRLLMLRPDKDI